MPTDDSLNPRILRDLQIRHEIEQCLRTYCRGVDRLDADLIAAAYHPGALMIDYGVEPRTIEQFAQATPLSLGTKFVASQHRLSNVTIDFVRNADGEPTSAKVESYVLAYHVQNDTDGRALHTFNGRYIDMFEARDAQWKIARRYLRVDFSSVEPIAETMGRPWWIPSGRGGSPDPLFDPNA